ncbi:N-acetyltransferase [Patiriisocius marinistellae]|uniref:N-acetyltransferase n=1 Tax=Patiriisocius marinistellae TaxID=2494560 RepID=A0A5J4G0M6_9FLAO|nr:GNAT family N-acetyltransferase [Patiriisocius marinistellae]GEQ85875.1 N-acetyltransferase [Patiriisocius marinistellae]
MNKIEREDKGKKGRFVIYENNEFAGEMTYTWESKSVFAIDHTEVEERFGGKGLGKKLVMEAIAHARKNNLKIKPLCSYVKKVFDNDDSLKDVRA